MKARLIRFERPVRHMYLDSRNNVTVGIGYMIPSESRPRDYQWVAKGTGRRATDQELPRDWNEVRKHKGKGWKAPAFRDKTHVEITNAYMNLLLQKKIYIYDQELRAALKQWNEKIKSDPDRYPGALPIEYGEQPPAVLEAMFDMIYTLARGSFLGYPKMLTAIGQRDWAKAAEESNRPDVETERNQAIRTMFLGAPADPMFSESWEPARDFWGSSES